MVKDTRLKLNNFYDMPLLLKIIFIAGLVSPVIAFISVISGSLLVSDAPKYEYGAANSLVELLLVIILHVPSLGVSILMLAKNKLARLLFPLGYFIASISPLFLLAFREDVEVAETIASSLFVGVLISVYLFISKNICKYFD